MLTTLKHRMRNKIKFISLLLALTISLAAFGTSLAQNSVAQPRNIDDLKQSRVLEARKRSVKRLMNNHISRVSRSISKLSSVLDRIETRREKMVAAGYNVDEIDDMIADAKLEKATAEEMLNDAKALYQQIDSATDPKVKAQEFIDAMSDFRKQMKVFHGSLKEIVKEMRDVEGSNRLQNLRNNSGRENN